MDIIKIDIKSWTKTCVQWHDDIGTNSLCCNILLLTSFYFLQVSKRNGVGTWRYNIVSPWLEWLLLRMSKEHTRTRSTNLLKRNYPKCVFDWEEKTDRCPILNLESCNEFLNSYFFNLRKSLFWIFWVATSEKIRRKKATFHLS